ncbi:MAG: hypothetical protein P8Y23_00720 [Candidatus Lokiarchaeota archaeon]
MSTKWEELIQSIIKTVGVAGVSELEKALAELESEAKKPWQKAILNIAGDLLAKHGIDGIKMLEALIENIMNDEVPDLSFASLRDRSDYLAAIQNMEADDKKKVREFFTKIGYSLGVVVKSIISGVLGFN